MVCVSVTIVLINVVGWTGMALLICAYVLVTAGRLLGTGSAFQLMNLVGGLFLMLNSAYYSAWPSAALNLVWFFVGTFGLLRLRRRAGTPPPSPRGGVPGP